MTNAPEIRLFYHWAHVTKINARYSVAGYKSATELLIAPARRPEHSPLAWSKHLRLRLMANPLPNQFS